MAQASGSHFTIAGPGGDAVARPVPRPFRSVLFIVLFIGFTLFYGFLTSPVLLLSQRLVIASGRFWSQVSIRLFCRVMGASLEVRGLDHLPEAPFLVCAKHQSALETLVLVAVLQNAAFMLKRELTWIPFYGWYLMRLGMPTIDRSGGARALKAMMTDARKVAGQGRPIVIFPEGTRTPPGRAGVWRGGGAMLASQLRVPVVPLALNTGLAWPKHPFVKSSARIVLAFLPPLAPLAPGGDKRAFLSRLASDAEAATRRLEAESGLEASQPGS